MSRSATATSLLVVAAVATAHAQRPNQGEDESAAFVNEGRADLRKGHLDDAAKALDQAIALNPRRVEAYVLRSAVYAARKQYKDGVALIVSRVERVGIDGDFQASGVLYGVVFKGAVDAIELAALGRKPEMIDFKQREGMAGVKLVSHGPNRGA